MDFVTRQVTIKCYLLVFLNLTVASSFANASYPPGLLYPLQQVLTSAPTKCPCHFMISTSLDAPSIDFLIVPHSQTRALNFSDITARNAHSSSRFRRKPKHAIHRDAFRAYHVVRVPSTETVSLHVRSDGVQGKLLPASILTSSRQTCDVILPEHPPSRTLNSHRDASSLASKIIGGRRAQQGIANYLVFLVTPVTERSVTLCTGAIISPSIVLTAAHCGITLETLVIPGVTQGFPISRSNIFRVQEYVRFRSFDPDASIAFSGKYDISYIRLTSNLPSFTRQVKVNTNPNIPVPGSIVRNAGFGRNSTAEGSSNSDGLLYQVDSPVVDASICRRRYLGNRVLDLDVERQLCAGFLDVGGCGACQGDSGGPLIQYDRDGEPVVVGVVSSSVDCASAIFPTIHVRTSAYNSFIPTDGVIRTSETDPFIPGTPPSPSGAPASDPGGTPSPSGPPPSLPTDDDEDEGLGISNTAIIVISVSAAVIAIAVIALVVWCCCI